MTRFDEESTTEYLDRCFPLPAGATDADRLLQEWVRVWLTSDEMPAKMPDALHVRTAVYFTSRKWAGASS